MMHEIFIFGNYGKKNVGDDAMIYSLIEQLNQCSTNNLIKIFSDKKILSPTQRNLKYVNRNFLTFIKEIVSSDMFLIGGGTHINDYGTSFKTLKILLQIWILVLIAKIFSNKILFIGIGIEIPSKYFWGYFLTKQICQVANFISVRDTHSYKNIRKMNLKTELTKSFDLSSTLNITSLGKDLGKKVLGISLMPFYETYYKNPGKDREFAIIILNGINKWINNDPNNWVYLFIFRDSKEDRNFNEFIQENIDSDQVKLIDYNDDPHTILAKIGFCDMFIGMKYHSCFFAYLNELPLIIINHFQKNSALAEDLKLQNYAVLSLDKVFNGEFNNLFQDFVVNPNKFKAELSKNDAIQLANKNLPDCNEFN